MTTPKPVSQVSHDEYQRMREAILGYEAVASDYREAVLSGGPRGGELIRVPNKLPYYRTPDGLIRDSRPQGVRGWPGWLYLDAAVFGSSDVVVRYGIDVHQPWGYVVSFAMNYVFFDEQEAGR